jgi:intracellular multiplication protein IcmK
MNNNLIYWLGLTTFLVINSMLLPIYAAEPESAQQALQQLRLLQQRLQTAGNQLNAPPPAPGGPVAVGGPGAVGTTPAVGGPVPQIPGRPGLVAGITPPLVVPRNIPQEQKQIRAEQIVTPEENELIDLKAYEGVIRQLFPLTPEQLIRLRQLYQASEFAETTTPGTPPRPTATSQFVNLSPGSTPPVIRLSQGFVTSLVFLDSTGAPWPISAYDLGDPSAFNIQWDKTSNTLMIQALRLYNYGNLAIRLRGLNTPVMLTLIPGQKAVDYRVDLRIQGYGPKAKRLPLEEGLPPHASDILLHVLDGVPPQGSQRLTVSGGDARAWAFNDRMYVRTNLTILSPGWIASMTSADGMHAYEMQKSPVLLVSWHGKVMQLKVEGL